MVSSSHTAVWMIVARAACSHCSHSRGLCGCSSTGRSQCPQIEQRPSWASKSLRLALSIDRGGGLASSLGPVGGQGGVVRGRRALNHPVPDDPGPGELLHVGAACAVAEHPSVTPGLVELAEVPGDDPGRRFVRVGEQRPLVGQSPHVVIQRGERLAGDHAAVVGGPPPNDRVEPSDHRAGVASRAGSAARCGACPGSVSRPPCWV